MVHIDFNINIELDSLREVNQQLSEDNQELRDQLALVQLSEGIIETQPTSAQLMGKSFLMPSVTTLGGGMYMYMHICRISWY